MPYESVISLLGIHSKDKKMLNQRDTCKWHCLQHAISKISQSVQMNQWIIWYDMDNMIYMCMYICVCMWVRENIYSTITWMNLYHLKQNKQVEPRKINIAFSLICGN